MAKALIWLKAAGDASGLVDRLQLALVQQFEGLDHVTVRLMRAPEFDPLYNSDSPHAHPDVTIELLTAPGLSLASVQTPLLQSLTGLGIDRAGSLALVMHQRVYLPHEPQPTNIHYLMLRREDLSNADYCDYYSHYHCYFGLHCPGIVGYSQNYVDQVASENLCQLLGMAYREVTSISEMNTSSLEAFLSSPAIAELAEPTRIDEEHFVNRTQSVMFASEVCFELGDLGSIHQPVHAQYYDD